METSGRAEQEGEGADGKRSLESETYHLNDVHFTLVILPESAFD